MVCLGLRVGPSKAGRPTKFRGVQFWLLASQESERYKHSVLSGPLDRLNAILSLLQPLDRYRAPSAIGSAIGRPLSRPISHLNIGGSPHPPRSKPLRGFQPHDSGAIVSRTPSEQARNKNAIEAAILNRVLDCD